jgi:hypothetical protein
MHEAVLDLFHLRCAQDAQAMAWRQFQAAEEVLLYKLYAILDAPFFIALSDAASTDFEAVMVGEVQIARVELWRLANGMAYDRRFAVVDHDALGDTHAESMHGVARNIASLAGTPLAQGYACALSAYET